MSVSFFNFILVYILLGLQSGVSNASGTQYQDIAAVADELQGGGKYLDAIKLLQTATDCFPTISPLKDLHCEPIRGELAVVLFKQGKYEGSESLLISIISMMKDVPGTALNYALRLNTLAAVYQKTRHSPEEIEHLYDQALDILDESHPEYRAARAMVLTNLGVLNSTRHPAVAQASYQKALNLRRDLSGAQVERGIALDLKGLGILSELSGDNLKGETLYRQALDYVSLPHEESPPDQAAIQADLAEVLLREGQYTDAEYFAGQALSWMEINLEPTHPDLLNTLNTQAVILSRASKYQAAIAIHKRILSAREAARGGKEFGADVSQSEVNIGELLEIDGQLGEAKSYLLRSIASVEADPDATKSDIGYRYIITGRFYREIGHLDESITALETALSLEETGAALDELGKTYELKEDWKRAELFHRRAIAVLSTDTLHADYGTARANLGYLLLKEGRWNDAADELSIAADVGLQRTKRLEISGSNSVSWDTRLEADDGLLRLKGLVKALHRVSTDHTGQVERDEAMFRAAQLAQSSESGLAVRQMAARAAMTDPTLAGTLRTLQDLTAQRQELQEALMLQRAIGDSRDNAEAAATLWTKITTVDKSLAQLGRSIGISAHLIYSPQPVPLSIIEVQRSLKADEVLVYVFDTPAIGNVPEETFVWLISNNNYIVNHSDEGSIALTSYALKLRCGLDPSMWEGLSSPELCTKSLGLTRRPSVDLPLPFDLGAASHLYTELLANGADLISGKTLVVVAAGALAGIPFQVFVTDKPIRNIPHEFGGYEAVSWLVKHNAIVMIPEVSDLSQFRIAAAPKSTEPYTAYADPLLRGDGSCNRFVPLGNCLPKSAKAVRHSEMRWAREVSRSSTVQSMFGGSHSESEVVNRVQSLCPLPDTATEVKCVAAAIGAPLSELRIGPDATADDLKKRSENGDLARYRVIHFATHGLMAGDTAFITAEKGQPALVMTPGAPGGQGATGLLDTTHIAELRMDADWVILSACNTAAGSEGNPSPLSGLARAFFYAGARSLLVSNWPVYSDAAARLVSDMFQQRAHGLSKAEALRAAELALISDNTEEDNSSPSVWSPFSLIGVER